MELVDDILQQQVNRIGQKVLQIDRDKDQVPKTGNKKETVYNLCRCEQYAGIRRIIETCYKFKSPFEEDLCSTARQKWQHTLTQAGVYERFWESNFTTIEKRGVPEEIVMQYRQVRTFVDNLDKNLMAGAGLILKGPVGTMKTTLAVAILQEALWRGMGCRKILMQSLLDEIFSRKAYNLDDWLGFEKDLKECRLLVVDELGKHQSEGWVMTKFEAIVSERHERRRSTIFVTNLTAREMRGLYSEGIIDRFNHVNQVINFTGKSQRVKGD